jgi:exonuclease VII small subunit
LKLFKRSNFTYSMNNEEIQQALQEIIEKIEEIQSRLDDVLSSYGRTNSEEDGVDID